MNYLFRFPLPNPPFSAFGVEAESLEDAVEQIKSKPWVQGWDDVKNCLVFELVEGGAMKRLGVVGELVNQ